MAKFVNSFALLDDEEDDDVAVLVDRIVKKVDITPLMLAQQSSNFVQNENGGRRGGQGFRNGYGGNDNVEGGYYQEGHRRNYSRDSYGSEGGIEDDGRRRGNGGDCGRGKGRGRGFSGEYRRRNVNEGSGEDRYQTENDGDDGWQAVLRSHGKGFSGDFGRRNVNGGNGGDRYDSQYDDAGWQDASKSDGKGYGNNGRSFGDRQERLRNGNGSSGGERRGHREQVQGNDAADGQRGYRSGHRRYGGERRGYGDQFHDNDAAEGQRRYRNGGRSFAGERRGYSDQVQVNDAGFEQPNGEGDVYEDTKSRGEDNYRNENRNGGGERRSYGGYKGRGRHEYRRRTGSDELKLTGNVDEGLAVKVGHVNGSGSDGAVILEASKAAETEVQNEEVNGGISDVREAGEEQKEEESKLKKKQFDELKQKKNEEEDKEATYMTLDQYEKLLLEKRRGLESRKTEKRRVAIDKDLQGMRLVEKKPDESDERVKKPVKGKLKTKNSLKKQASGSLKTKSEVDDSDAKQNSEDEKLKTKESLEKKEKGRKYVAVEVHGIFSPAFQRRSFGGRGQGRGGRGRGQGQGAQGGSSVRGNSGVPRTNRSARTLAPASRRAPSIPTDRDFPVLGAAPAHVKA